MQHSVTWAMSWWSLRPGKNIGFQHAGGLQTIVVCWLLKQKHLKKEYRSFLVFYTVVIKDNIN